MKYLVYTLSVLLFFVSNSGFGQDHVVKGKVLAFKKYPLNNIEVSSKKMKTEVFTDADGHFSIVCSKNSQLTFSAPGFYTQKIKINDEEYIAVNLIVIEQEAANKDVVKGEHMTKDQLDYALENLLDENNNFEQLATIYDVIQFVYPQAKVVDPATVDGAAPGDFGGTGPQIILDSRGLNSVNASQYALLVVDGVIITDISGVHPIEVKSVKVLMGNKADHWGMRGGNGVVEITTKFQ